MTEEQLKAKELYRKMLYAIRKDATDSHKAKVCAILAVIVTTSPDIKIDWNKVIEDIKRL